MNLPDILFGVAVVGTAAILVRAARVSAAGARLGASWSGLERRGNPAARPGQDRRRTWTWWLLALAVLTLGLARVTGGLDAAAAIARRIASEHDLYADRRPVQATVTIAFAVLWLGIVGAVFFSRRAHRRQRLAVFAAGIGLVVLAVRTVSWHAAAAALWSEVGGVRIVSVLESASLLGLAIAGTIVAWPRRRTQPADQPASVPGPASETV